MLAWTQDGPRVTRAFTGRAGGVSSGPYAALNLGARVGDDPAHVAGNRASLAAALRLPPDRVVFLHQIHSTEVAVVSEPPRTEPRADALVTGAAALALAVLGADCLPVLLADEAAGVIGAAHVGRVGMTEGIIAAVVAAMRDQGATEIDAVLGPAVCGRCYEVSVPIHDAAIAVAPEARAISATGTAALDITAGVTAQLDAEGVRSRQVLGCTREDADLYSYRKDGVTGRHAGVVVLRS